MASEKVQAILESIQGLTLLEAAELSKAMEEAFGVSARGAGDDGRRRRGRRRWRARLRPLRSRSRPSST